MGIYILLAFFVSLPQELPKYARTRQEVHKRNPKKMDMSLGVNRVRPKVLTLCGGRACLLSCSKSWKT
jgi:hypothetical protein